MPESNVAAALPDNLVTDAREDPNRFLAGNDGKLRAHRVTTTLPTNTREGSGISSWRAAMSSRQSSIAPLIASASSTVSPWL